jgi:Ca2+-binding RTX toxin-like protein
MASTRRICSLVSIGAALALLTLPAAAQAGVTCSLSSGVLTVDITAGSSAAGIQRGTGGGANDINVYDGTVNGGTLQSCTGSPSVTNTDSIQVNDTVASHNAELNLDLQHGPLEPGLTAEGSGTSEIEVTFSASDGLDRLRLTGQSTVSDNYLFGQTGATATGGNLNGDADVDDVTVNAGERMALSGGNQADDISVNGGTGFAGPVPYASGGSAALTIDGGLNDDHLTGGPGGWIIDTGNAAGNDTLTGGSGNDEIGAWGPGDDVIDGGAGSGDTVDYQFATPGNVHFDLGIAGPQDTNGNGNDSAVNVEGIVGSQSAGTDVLTGDAGNNIFFANDGDDLIVPKGGNDTVEAGLGADTVSYALGSAGPVAVGLVIGAQVTGGAGTDAFLDQQPTDGFTDVENLVGSPFGGDVLTGDAQPNMLDAYDGFGDTSDCVGPANGNIAIADELGVDAISNCDTVDNAPQTSIDSGPASGTVTNSPLATYGLSADEPSVFQYSIDSGAFTSCPANCALPPLADGAHTLAFRAVDQDENGHADLTPATRTLTVDNAAPETTIGSHPKPKTKSRKATFTFSSSEAGSSFLCSYDGKPYAACTTSFTTPKLKPGRHRFDVISTDAVGNRDQSAATFLWKVVKRKRHRR